ncbi:hypothetical protein V6Z96_004935 [Aspergillus fumigatus]|jgi:hypothetical protein
MDGLGQKWKLDKVDHFWKTPQQRRMAVIIFDACNHTSRYKNSDRYRRHHGARPTAPDTQRDSVQQLENQLDPTGQESPTDYAKPCDQRMRYRRSCAKSVKRKSI